MSKKRKRWLKKAKRLQYSNKRTKKPKRWGKKVTYIRNWKAVNEMCVRRGEFLLDLEWVQNWHKELEEMNKGKRGAPFEFPKSMIELQAVWTQWFSFRVAEGITRQIVVFSKLPKYNNYSTIYRRVTALEVIIPGPKKKEISVANDGSGEKMNKGGAYFHDKYGKKRRKYIKVVISGEPYDKDVLKVEVSVEGTGESEPDIAEQHMKELIDDGYIINEYFGDGAHDKSNLFNFCDWKNIKPIIKIRETAVIDPKGSWRRNREVEEYLKLGYKKWAEKKRYGRRWTGTEGIFSAVVRLFGDSVSSVKPENMCKEAKRRFWAYQVMRQYSKEKMKKFYLINKN